MSEKPLKILDYTISKLDELRQDLLQLKLILGQTNPSNEKNFDYCFREDELISLPWREFPNKFGYWIFSDLQDQVAKRLKDILLHNDGRALIHSHIYWLSEMGRFIVQRSEIVEDESSQSPMRSKPTS